MSNIQKYSTHAEWLLTQAVLKLAQDQSSQLSDFLHKLVVGNTSQQVLLMFLKNESVMACIRSSIEKDLELHSTQILNSKKLKVSKQIETAVALFTRFTAQTQSEYDRSIMSQY